MVCIYVEVQDDAIYTGVTDNRERRFEEHKQGKGGHYTNYNRPRQILYKEPFEDRLDAENREKQIKRWSKAKKLALINKDSNKLVELSKSRD